MLLIYYIDLDDPICDLMYDITGKYLIINHAVIVKRMILNFLRKQQYGTQRKDICTFEFTMSSGPSQLCLYSKPSGTILLSIISISSLTSGSQLSFNAKLAEVWRTVENN